MAAATTVSAPSGELFDHRQLIRNFPITELAAPLGIRTGSRRCVCPFSGDPGHRFCMLSTLYACFDCEVGGDAYDLVMRVRRVSYGKAVEWVAGHLNAELPGPARRGKSRRMRPLTPATDILGAFAYFVRYDPGVLAHRAGFSRLRGLGVGPETAAAAGVGCVDDPRATRYALARRFPRADLQSAGVLDASGALRFERNSLAVPYYHRGRVHAVLGLDPGRKSREGGAGEFLAGEPAAPFHADALDLPATRVYLTSGVLDCLRLLDLGLVAVAAPGPLGFRPEWAPLFRQADEVVVTYPRGREAARGRREALKAFLDAGIENVRSANWPGGSSSRNRFHINY